MIYFEQDKIFAVKKSEKTEIIMTKAELEAFLAVLQYGSISAAAERLFITQPAMSRRMKSMEEELGYSLFERGRGQRSVELTENGKRIRSGRGTPVDTLQGGGGDTEKKEKSASASQHSEQHCFLSDAGCIERNDVRSGHLQH